MKTAQFLLTQFNIQVEFAGRRDRGIDDQWLTHRFDLFENFCLPSVTAQSQNDFIWLIEVDERTPERWLSRLNEGLASWRGKAVIVPATEDHAAQLTDAVARIAADLQADRVITTRMDNDDAIAGNYLSDVADTCRGLRSEGTFVIDYPCGCQFDRSGIFAVTLRMNPFLSVLSSRSDLRTAFYTRHRKMAQAGTVIEVMGNQPDPAMWMQVFHSRNLKNRHPKKQVPIDENRVHNFSLAQNWKSFFLTERRPS